MTTGYSIIGLGTIGTGVFELWRDNRALMHQRGSTDLELVEVADVRAPDHLQTGNVRYSNDAFKTIQADDVNIVVELIGGDGVAHDVVRAALEQGKSVVTANKALIAKHGDSLHELADKNHCYLAYEASVCGGIPLLSSIKQGLVANRISNITGTVNGTCNYILSRMLNEDMDFSDALDTAQKLGFAEADPSFDIDGIDAAHKTTILAGLAFGIPFNLKRCHTVGIRDVAVADLHYCDRLGFRLMHLSRCLANENGVQLGAFPGLVTKSHILSNTFMEMNAAAVDGDGTGSTFYYGAGAGARPTASAVISDVVNIATQLKQSSHQGGGRWLNADQAIDGANANINRADSKWYLRFITDENQILNIDEQLSQCGIIEENSLCCSTETGKYFDSPEFAKGAVDYVVLTETLSFDNLNTLRQSQQFGNCISYPVIDLPA